MECREIALGAWGGALSAILSVIFKVNSEGGYLITLSEVVVPSV